MGANKTWAKLKELYLASNQIGKAGTLEIVINMTWKKMSNLSLKNNKIKGSMYEVPNQFEFGKCWNKLRKFDFSISGIFDDVAIRIAVNSFWETLELLDLSYNIIGDKGFGAIGNNKY